MPRTTRRRALAALTARALQQSGLFTLEDAQRLDVDRQVVTYHARDGGRWRRVLPQVYELVDAPPDPLRAMLAAQLWAGPRAVLSHRAAAWILGLDGIREARPEILSPGRKASAAVIVHRGAVPPSDLTTTGPLRHTTIPRTVVDLASVLDDETLELALESALRRNPRWEGRFHDAAQSRQTGCRALSRVLRLRGCAPPTESELETRYIQLLRTVDIPPPVRQFRVIDHQHHVLGRLDLCWPEAKVWVELDSRTWHDRPEALFRDRQRQNDVVAELQWLPLRFTWRDVLGHPHETAAKTQAVYQGRLHVQAPTAVAT